VWYNMCRSQRAFETKMVWDDAMVMRPPPSACLADRAGQRGALVTELMINRYRAAHYDRYVMRFRRLQGG